jgi:hypothetical protein
MSDNINIGSIQAGVVITGGRGHTVRSGNVGVRADLARSVIQLRGLLNHLVQLSAQNVVSPQVRAFVSAAAAEATKATLDISRLRALMDAVRADVGKADPVARAALNVIDLITVIEEATQLDGAGEAMRVALVRQEQA